MVGQKVQSASVEQMIEETHTASLAEFELAKQAQINATFELQALKDLALEIHALVTEAEKKFNP